MKVQSASLLLMWIPLVFLVQCARGGTLAQFRTAYGDIVVELYDQEKPVTVENFIHYVQAGRYTNMLCHRLIPGQILQGGGYMYDNDLHRVPVFLPIDSEFGNGSAQSNVFGTIAMAKTPGDTNSANSQWFFNLADNPSFDVPDTNNSFVVFGRVISGTNILSLFNTFQKFNGLQQSNIIVDLDGAYGSPELGTNFGDFPLRYPTPASSNFVYLDITLLQVSITSISGGCEIAWDSTSGLINIVEFTTSIPPVWQPLVNTNGTGHRMTFFDAVDDPKRFYRVRVPY